MPFASIILGSGGALLWITQGTWMTETLAGEDVGKLNGLFWLIFNMCVVLGSSALSALYFLGIDIDLYMIPRGMCLIGVIGCVMFLGVRMPPTSPTQTEDNEAFFKKTFKSVWDILKMFGTAKFLVLTALFALQGTTGAFLGGAFPLLVNPAQVSTLFLCLGIAKMLFSYAAGICYDVIGWQFVIICNLIVTAGGYTSIAFGVWNGNVLFMYAAAALLGISEAIMLLVVTATITLLYPEGTDKAFAAYRFINALFVAAGFFVSPLLTWREIAAFNFTLAALSVVLFFILYCVILRNEVSYAPLQKNTQQEEELQGMDPAGMC